MNLKKLKLHTSRLDEMKNFYQGILELKVKYECENEFAVQMGSTELTFKQTDLEINPFYHFAINIPENKLSEAKAWIQAKIKLNTHEGDDEVFFDSWNAHAIYFEDPAGNIVELIARHHLNNASEHSFSSKDLLNISEVGIPVNEVIPFVRKLNEIGIPNWREDSESFTPVGDENGLFIVVKKGRLWFFSNQHAKFYPLEGSIDGIGGFIITEKDHLVLTK